MKGRILKLLYRSFDRKLSKKEHDQLNDALSNSESLQEKKSLLLKVRDTLSTLEKPAVEPDFSNRVMAEIYTLESEKEQDLFYDSLVYLFRRVAVAVTMVLVIILFYIYFSTGSLDPIGIADGSDINFEELIDSDTNIALE
jgi:hypothetical protein